MVLLIGRAITAGHTMDIGRQGGETTAPLLPEDTPPEGGPRTTEGGALDRGTLNSSAADADQERWSKMERGSAGPESHRASAGQSLHYRLTILDRINSRPDTASCGPPLNSGGGASLPFKGAQRQAS